MTETNAIEVGHTFLLGDKYSKIFKASYTDSEGKRRVMQMGCYGLGVSRIMAAALQVLSNENKLRWPLRIVPFKVVILAPKEGSKEVSVMDQVFHLYDHLNSHQDFSNDVIIDDRPDLTVGKKLRDAKKTGYPFIVLFGKSSIDPLNPVVELHQYEEMIKLPVNQVMYHFESINVNFC